MFYEIFKVNRKRLVAILSGEKSPDRVLALLPLLADLNSAPFLTHFTRLFRLLLNHLKKTPAATLPLLTVAKERLNPELKLRGRSDFGYFREPRKTLTVKMRAIFIRHSPMLMRIKASYTVRLRRCQWARATQLESLSSCFTSACIELGAGRWSNKNI